MKTPEEVIGRHLTKMNCDEPYEYGDYEFDAKAIVNALSLNGFKITRKRRKK